MLEQREPYPVPPLPSTGLTVEESLVAKLAVQVHPERREALLESGVSLRSALSPLDRAPITWGEIFRELISWIPRPSLRR